MMDQQRKTASWTPPAVSEPMEVDWLRKPYSIGPIRVSAAVGAEELYDRWIWKPNERWAETALRAVESLAITGSFEFEEAFGEAAARHEELMTILGLAALGSRRLHGREP